MMGFVAAPTKKFDGAALNQQVRDFGDVGFPLMSIQDEPGQPADKLFAQRVIAHANFDNASPAAMADALKDPVLVRDVKVDNVKPNIAGMFFEDNAPTVDDVSMEAPTSTKTRGGKKKSELTSTGPSFN
jgi:hypothetical protein